jgi:hypothetical protein
MSSEQMYIFFQICKALFETPCTFFPCSPYPSTVKMETIHSSEMSVNIDQTAQYHFSEDSTLHNNTMV